MPLFNPIFIRVDFYLILSQGKWAYIYLVIYLHWNVVNLDFYMSQMDKSNVCI